MPMQRKIDAARCEEGVSGLQGAPRMSASAMVPGPAFVTTQSHAPIHSDMLLTNPVDTI